MLAEHRHKAGPQASRLLTLIALYEREEDASALLDRLAALNVNTGEATLLRVARGERGGRTKPLTHLLPSAEQFPAATRYAVTGAILGGALAVLGGFLLYQSSYLNLTFLEGLLAHTLAMVLLGAVLGAALGALLAAARPDAPLLPPPDESDGFLVLVRTPQRLAEQAETIARQLGAKEITL
jgi:hypothetical protein